MSPDSQIPLNNNQIIPLVIIGGGFSAAALVLHLCKDNPERANKITIVSEDSGKKPFGSGAAFGTDNPHFRLNVRSDIMKLFSDRPDEFGAWATTHISDKQASRPEGNFYRRQDFARYLTERLDKICKDGLPQQIHSTVLSMRYQQDVWHISHSAGDRILARHVVLATGNPAPTWPCKIDQALAKEGSPAAKNLVVNPWDGRWLCSVDSHYDLCLLGGGLTAMDGIYAAYNTGFSGRIFVVSPHGILPPSQTDWQARPAVSWPEGRLSASGFLHYSRQVVSAEGDDWTQTGWQELFESLRIHLSDKWRELTDIDKRRLLANAGSWWSLARYRSAPQNFEAAQKMLANGQLLIVKDRVTGIMSCENRFQLELASGDKIESDMVVNCSGVAKDKLFQTLLETDIIHSNAFGDGPEVAQNLAVLHPEGHAYNTLFALGAATKGSCGDVVGAGTIAQQAEQLSKILASKISSDLC